MAISLGPSGLVLNDGTFNEGSDFGNVLQVVSTSRTNHFTTSSASYVDYMTQSITPSSTSSKILVMAYFGTSSDSTNMFGYAKLRRGTSDIALGDSVGSAVRAWVDIGSNNGSNYFYRVQNLQATWVDSPSTTSAITYKIMVKRTANGTIYFNRSYDQGDSNRGSTPSIFVLMEIAG